MTKCISVFVVSFVGGAAYCNNDDDNEPDDDEPDDNEPEVDILNCFWKTFFIKKIFCRGFYISLKTLLFNYISVKMK